MLPELHIAMTETIEHFKKGVHKEGDCGNNRSGYAAIASSIIHCDPHSLDIGDSLTSFVPQESTQKKKSFSQCDTLVYMFLKCILRQRSSGIYVLFLSSFISSTLDRMISSVSNTLNAVLTVQQTGDEYLVTMSFRGNTSSCLCSTPEDLIYLCKCLSKMDNTIALVYPDVCDVYIEALSEIQPSIWCLSASRSKVYVSRFKHHKYSHYVFPWSRSPTCHGFTIGEGQPRTGSVGDCRSYISSFSFYEKMVSSVPMQGSCVDCYALTMMVDMLSALINKTRQKHSHTLSSSSIEILEDLKKMMFVPPKEF